MKRDQGFTLIELMIVIAVIGILMAIAIPNYNDYITRSKITEVVSTLSDARVRMDQYFQDNRYYNDDGTASAACAPTVTFTATRNFSYACVASNNGLAYVWTGTGLGSMTGFSYTINQVNARTSAIASGAAWPVIASTPCWITNKGGC